MKGIIFSLFLISIAWGQTSITPASQTKKYSNIWLVTEFNLNGFTWKDLNIEKESSFTGPLDDAWKKWIKENLLSNVGGVEICQESCRSFLNNWESRPASEIISAEIADYNNGVWLKMTVDLKRSARPSANEVTFEWGTRSVLLEINTKRLLGSSETLIQSKTWIGDEQKSVNSRLASLIYQTSLSNIDKFQKAMSSTLQLNRVINLKVEGHKNLGDIMELMTMMKNRGTHLGIEVKLKSFKGNEAQVICFFQGEEKAFSDLLSQLKELKSSQSYRLESGRSGEDHFIKLSPDHN